MRKVYARSKSSVFKVIVAMALGVLASSAFSNEHPAERVIHLDGTTNTRDIGGYLTDDQRSLRWGEIIRSENLSRLTASDFQKLEEIGVKTVIDLRTDHEHDKAPTVWQGDNPPQFYHFPVGDAKNEWFTAQRNMLKKNRFTEKQSTKLMVEGYRMIADEGPSSYRQLLELVLDESNRPVLIHCNAGKDRAGVAVTLILEALGVDRETIMEEFLLTNEIGRSEDKAALIASKSQNNRRIGRSPSANAWLPIVGVQAEMLDAFYASVNERYGSMDAFLTELGVDQDARKTFTASVTTQPQKLAMND